MTKRWKGTHPAEVAWANVKKRNRETFWTMKVVRTPRRRVVMSRGRFSLCRRDSNSYLISVRKGGSTL